MSGRRLVLLGILVLAVLVIPVVTHLSSATPQHHKGPLPFPPNLIPPIDPNNHHHLAKRGLVPIGKEPLLQKLH